MQWLCHQVGLILLPERGLFVDARYNNDISTLSLANASLLLEDMGIGDDWAQGVETPPLDKNQKEPPESALPIQPFPAIQPSPETLLQPKSIGGIPKQQPESAGNIATRQSLLLPKVPH